MNQQSRILCCDGSVKVSIRSEQRTWLQNNRAMPMYADFPIERIEVTPTGVDQLADRLSD